MNYKPSRKYSKKNIIATTIKTSKMSNHSKKKPTRKNS